MPSASSLAITWLGHSTFLIDLPSGQRLVTDPWLGNPNCPAKYRRPESLGRVDLILVSHGHDDHLADAAALSRATHAPVVCLFEVGEYLRGKGLQEVRDMGIGGTQVVDGIRVTMTFAAHSGSITRGGEIQYLGGAAGFVVRADATPTLYFAGDTGLFGDMKIIGEIYAPAIAFLPIGDHYTMGPDTAAIAARWLNVRQVVPMHWGTTPLLTGTPAMLRAALAGTIIDVLEITPGQRAE
jgi:L-ascorbate metabolism protein UlaG (beta-lactamase superfamily)